MIDIFASRLADCLENLKRGESNVQECLQKYPQDSEELEKLLELAIVLEDLPVQLPDENFEKAARARLLHSAAELSEDRVISRVKSFISSVVTSPTRPVMKLGLLAVMLVFLLGSSLVFASAKAMPGDFLYPAKIFFEDARLMITGDEKETDLQIDLASERVKEVDRLVQEQHYDDIEAVVERYVRHVDKMTESVTSKSIDQDEMNAVKSELIYSNLEHHLEILWGLMENVPEQAQQAIEKAIEASSKNKDKLQELFPDGKPGTDPKDKDESDRTPQNPIIPPGIDQKSPEEVELPAVVPENKEKP
jgi:hypothetical protein